MSQKHERARHEALAREIAAWTSWTVDRWFTNGHMAFEMAEPVSPSHMRMEFECSCDDNGRRDHLHTLERPCTFVDVYERDPKIFAALTRRLNMVQANNVGVRLTIEEPSEPVQGEASLMYYRARIGGDPAPHAWVALNDRYVHAIRRYAQADQWFLMGMPSRPVGTRFDVSEAPWVVAVRGQHRVGIVMPMVNNDSAIGMEIEAPTYTGAASPEASA